VRRAKETVGGFRTFAPHTLALEAFILNIILRWRKFYRERFVIPGILSTGGQAISNGFLDYTPLEKVRKQKREISCAKPFPNFQIYFFFGTIFVNMTTILSNTRTYANLLQNPSTTPRNRACACVHFKPCKPK